MLFTNQKNIVISTYIFTYRLQFYTICMWRGNLKYVLILYNLINPFSAKRLLLLLPAKRQASSE